MSLNDTRERLNDRHDQNKFELSDGDYEPIKKSFLGSVVGAIKNSFKGRNSSQNVGRSRSLITDGDILTGQYLPKQGLSQSIFRDPKEVNDYSGYRISPNEYNEAIDSTKSRINNSTVMYGRAGVDEYMQSARQQQHSQQHMYQPRKVIIPAQMYQAYKQYKQQQSSSQQNMRALLEQQMEQVQILSNQNEQLLAKADEMRAEYVRLAKEATVTAIKFPSRLHTGHGGNTSATNASVTASQPQAASKTAATAPSSFGSAGAPASSASEVGKGVQSDVAQGGAEVGKQFNFNFGGASTGSSVAPGGVGGSAGGASATGASVPTFSFGSAATGAAPQPRAETAAAAPAAAGPAAPAQGFFAGASSAAGAAGASGASAVPAASGAAPSAAMAAATAGSWAASLSNAAAAPAAAAPAAASGQTAAAATGGGIKFNFGSAGTASAPAPAAATATAAAAPQAPAAGSDPSGANNKPAPFSFGTNAATNSTSAFQSTTGQTSQPATTSFTFNFGNAQGTGAQPSGQTQLPTTTANPTTTSNATQGTAGGFRFNFGAGKDTTAK